MCIKLHVRVRKLHYSSSISVYKSCSNSLSILAPNPRHILLLSNAEPATARPKQLDSFHLQDSRHVICDVNNLAIAAIRPDASCTDVFLLINTWHDLCYNWQTLQFWHKNLHTSKSITFISWILNSYQITNVIIENTTCHQYKMLTIRRLAIYNHETLQLPLYVTAVFCVFQSTIFLLLFSWFPKCQTF